jgi:hypothetical protein
MKILNTRWMECSMAIAVVAFALALLFPMTSTARSSGKSALCLANLHLLGRAWLAYAEDNNGTLCPGNTYNDQQWIGPPRTAGGVIITSNIPTSLDDEIRGYRAGRLWSYLDNSVVFHCPQDSRWESVGRGYRTFSIQGMMNGESSPNSPGYAKKWADIQSPARKVVFIENVDPRGWNMGSWIMNTGSTPMLIDPIAVFHPGCTGLVFADGHAEQHPWRGRRLLDWAYASANGPPNFSFSFTISDWSSPEAADVLYLAAGYTPGNP